MKYACAFNDNLFSELRNQNAAYRQYKKYKTDLLYKVYLYSVYRIALKAKVAYPIRYR